MGDNDYSIIMPPRSQIGRISLLIKDKIEGESVLVPKTITQNGTYDPSDDNADGYSEVVVNVSGGGDDSIIELQVTENGRYTAPSGNAYSPVIVDVPGPILQSKSVTPSAPEQTVQPDSGYDGLSSVIIIGDANLIAENIKKDVEIFGVVGTFTGSGGRGPHADVLCEYTLDELPMTWTSTAVEKED